MIQKLACISTLLVCACAPVRRVPPPAYELEWPVIVQQSSVAADSGNYAAADRILADFSARFTGSRLARETLFWRALYQLDPANSGGSMTSGLAALDRYIADSSTILYRPEATILKRLAATTQLLQAKALTPPVRDTTIANAANEAEVAQLRDQLAKTTAELERIKKRLANPNK